MSDLPDPPAVPCELAVGAEAAGEERAERWLFVRQVAIVLVLAALVVSHSLLG